LQSSPTTFYYPTFRIDYNTTEKLRFHLAFNETKEVQPGAGYSLRRFTEPQQYFWNQATNYGSFYYQNFNLYSNNTGTTGSFAPGSLSLGQSLPPYAFNPAAYSPTNPQANATFQSRTYLGNDVNGLNPKIAQPYTQSWNLGIQRQLPGAGVLEIRYNGSRTIHQWLSENINEVNVFENGFLTQFQAAQRNLKINQQHNINGVNILDYS